MSTLIALHAVVSDKEIESFPLSIAPKMLGIEQGEMFWIEVRIHKGQPAIHEPAKVIGSRAPEYGWADQTERLRDAERMQKAADQLAQEVNDAKLHYHFGDGKL